LQELIDAGVTTFKIEGRLKDADYVTNITAYYREKLSEFRIQNLEFRTSFTPDPEKTFHRGATDYFLHGRTRPMANWNTPKSTGEYIGEVLEAHGNTLRVRLKSGVALHNGDGLTIGSEGFSVNGVEGSIIKINKPLEGRYNGITLYRNNDVEFAKNLKSERRIPVDIVFRETEDGFELSYRSDFKFMISNFKFAHEPAKNAEKALETIRTQLSKLGDTPYVAREIRIESAPYFIPISILNEWRRNTII
jgi:putative protease